MAVRPARLRMMSSRSKLPATWPIARCEWKCLPSKLVMPAPSWPRCWSACRPKAAKLAALSAPQMPNTPHSSCSLSSSNGLVVSKVRFPRARSLQLARHIGWGRRFVAPRLNKTLNLNRIAASRFVKARKFLVQSDNLRAVVDHDVREQGVFPCEILVIGFGRIKTAALDLRGDRRLVDMR